MVCGAIEGQDAKLYDKQVSSSERTIIYDRFILESIKNIKNAKICDLCCGSGISINLLKNMAKEITGIDVSPEMIKICRKKFANNKNTKLKLSSAIKTNLKSGYFDYVIMRMGLHHIREKDKVLSEVQRILKQGGKLILIDKFYISKKKYYITGVLKTIFKLDKSLLNHFIISKDDNEKLLHNKFKIIKQEFVHEPEGNATQSFMLILEKI